MTGLPDRNLHLTCKVHESAMFLRTELATATCNDGAKVEVATLLNGQAVVVTVEPTEGPTRSYILTVEALVRAVLNAEETR